MTIHAELGIGEALTRLAVARGGTLDDITAEVYLDRLQRFDAALVRRACAHWSDIARSEFEPTLPAVGQIIGTIEALVRSDADAASLARLLPKPKSEDDEPRYFCRDCRDEPGAWRVFWCPGGGQYRATEPHERHADLPRTTCSMKTHMPHTFAERCGCRDVNPVIDEHRRRSIAFHSRKAARD